MGRITICFLFACIARKELILVTCKLQSCGTAFGARNRCCLYLQVTSMVIVLWSNDYGIRE
jgi:hypothetical protein